MTKDPNALIDLGVASVETQGGPPVLTDNEGDGIPQGGLSRDD
jgi:hypothetical protein